jgi:pantoate--beta-alanine ligase
VKTVRAESGLALSSRNQRLSPQGVIVAARLGKALTVTCELLQAGDSIENAKAAGLKILQSEDIKQDYFEVCDVDLNVATESTKVFRVLLAAIVEGVRLIDNMEAVRN